MIETREKLNWQPYTKSNFINNKINIAIAQIVEIVQ